MKKTITIASITILSFLSCNSVPSGVSAVENFNTERYLGQWYEIARFDHRFERGLSNVTANYTLNEDGSIKVLNRGYNKEKNKWKESLGKAKFVGDKTKAQLKVSFFEPFYGGYNVIYIDNEYKYALVCGPSKKYLWILSRERTIPEEIKQQLLKIIDENGFDKTKLEWVEQTKQE